MNLTHLFDMQRKLNGHINAEHPPQQNEDRMSKMILALLVELGECANELPEVFKFWSGKKNNMEKALEEYSDCLHFILSIGLELKIDETTLEDVGIYYRKDVTRQFARTMEWAIGLFRGDADELTWTMLAQNFVGLGKLLGFTWEQIEEAYMSKNATNHSRQNNGY